jgi:uncharacterized membrane protein YoaK (UPF0700 family)
LSKRALEVPRPAVALFAFAAGVVDACTYLGLFGLFVAQVTGSFVIVGAQLVSLDPSAMIRTLAIPVFFLAGFIAALLVGLAAKARTALVWALAAEIVLIGGFVAVGRLGAPFDSPNAPLALAASVLGLTAMGLQSALVRLLMRGISSTNVMTTNTTQAALDLAHWLAAAHRARKAPEDEEAVAERREARARWAKLWPALAGFLVGAIIGAAIFMQVGFWAPLLSVAVLIGLLAWTLWAAPRR